LIEKVQIKKSAYKKLLNLLQKHTPNIICGFLVGDRDDKSKIILVTDAKEIKTRCNPKIHFQPDFSDFRRVADEIHKEGKSIVGEFHTHPQGNSNPTGRDMKIMRWLKTGFWIIVSKNSISAMIFDVEELKINITKIPIEIV
jgi:proteasome lid subunit RPN8/RPN11